MTSETDAEFVEIMMEDGDWQPGSRMHRLALLARRGAAMTSEMDAKEPHVHSSEHNPERDIPSPQAAPQPGNDPSGIAAKLIRLAQQFEDQHAPQHMTILIREAASRISAHRAETLEYLGQVGQLSDELERLRAALKRLRHNASPMMRGWIDAALEERT